MNIELQKSTFYSNSVFKNCHFFMSILNHHGGIFILFMDIHMLCGCGVCVCVVCVYHCGCARACMQRAEGSLGCWSLLPWLPFSVRMLRCMLVALALHGFWASELRSSHTLLTEPSLQSFYGHFGR